MQRDERSLWSLVCQRSNERGKSKYERTARFLDKIEGLPKWECVPLPSRLNRKLGMASQQRSLGAE